MQITETNAYEIDKYDPINLNMQYLEDTGPVNMENLMMKVNKTMKLNENKKKRYKINWMEINKLSLKLIYKIY